MEHLQLKSNWQGIDDLLKIALEYRASDLHISVDVPPILRIDGRLKALGSSNLSREQTKRITKELLT